ncbi:MAG: acetyl-CoA C-acyltransferase, partial [Planctomycetota bacterium]|nr:acetyl-CoA C-acyltransferase [Planctomycetota bacterium]
MPVTDLWILSAARTPIGRFLGGLSSMSAVELGVVAGKSAIERAGLDVAAIDEAIIGCVLSAGLGQAPARQVALGCGMPATSSALTVNMVCGSGLR